MKKYLSIAVVLITSVVPLAAKLTPLAPRPDWSRLDAYQETITRTDFTTLLARIYAPGGAANSFITISEKDAMIYTGGERPPYILRFAPNAASAKSPPAYWRNRRTLPSQESGRPLAGIKIALDPGHLGGTWAKMEERWFQIGNSTPVAEGDMTLKVAKLLVPRLTALGAQVYLTRSKPGPTTSQRPSQFTEAAAQSLRNKNAEVTRESIIKESETLFYRASEIRRRARLINESIRPDIVLCLHFNAEDWGSENNPRLVDENHLHLLVSGAWNKDELDYEDQRLEMLIKLLNRSLSEELPLTEAIARSMAKTTGLSPYTYRGNVAIRVNDDLYIWARNLLANRLFTCPVVYVEPYVMNSRSVFARIQAGDYHGRRSFGDVSRQSIYREYVDGIVTGLVNYYSRR